MKKLNKIKEALNYFIFNEIILKILLLIILLYAYVYTIINDKFFLENLKFISLYFVLYFLFKRKKYAE